MGPRPKGGGCARDGDDGVEGGEPGVEGAAEMGPDALGAEVVGGEHSLVGESADADPSGRGQAVDDPGVDQLLEGAGGLGIENRGNAGRS